MSMATPVEAYPDYREIDTPWEPQTIAWRFPDSDDAIDQQKKGVRDPNSILLLNAQISNQSLTHLVREVAVGTRRGVSGLEMSPEETRHDLVLVDAQFRQLEDLTGFRVAPTEWHVFKDARGLTRTLARVGIVDSFQPIPDIQDFIQLAQNSLLSPQDYELSIQFLTNINKYFEKGKGDLLGDVDRPNQYIFGALRGVTDDPAFYLVDIEPDLQPDIPYVDYSYEDKTQDEHCQYSPEVRE